MTGLSRAVRAAVVEGGALAAAVYDRSTYNVIEGYAHRELDCRAILELLLGDVMPSGPMSALHGGAPVRAARVLCVVGAERTLFVSTLETGEVIVVSTRSTMSVALGWTLVGSLTNALGEP
ncbi:MAG: hypothetical protein R3B48_07745 [Kofleriaceae bacterium]